MTVPPTAARHWVGSRKIHRQIRYGPLNFTVEVFEAPQTWDAISFVSRPCFALSGWWCITRTGRCACRA